LAIGYWQLAIKNNLKYRHTNRSVFTNRINPFVSFVGSSLESFVVKRKLAVVSKLWAVGSRQLVKLLRNSSAYMRVCCFDETFSWQLAVGGWQKAVGSWQKAVSSKQLAK